MHSVKTKAKLLSQPVEQAQAGQSVTGGESASKRARRKRRRQGAGFEDEYEDVARKAVTWDEEAESSIRQLLPVKTKRGFVSQSTSGRGAETVSANAAWEIAERGSNERESDERETSHKGGAEDARIEEEDEEEGEEGEGEEEKEEEEEEEEEGWAENGAKSTAELLAARQRKLQEKKALIAATSARLLENPEDNVWHNGPMQQTEFVNSIL